MIEARPKPNDKSGTRPGMLRGVLGVALLAGFVWGWRTAVGQWWWWEGVVYIGLLAVGQTTTALLVEAKQKGLMRRRGAFGQGTKGWDKLCLSLMAAGTLAIILTAAWDNGRTGWGPLPRWWWSVGLLAFAAYFALLAWSMRHNRFFEKTVRIQHDQGHTVVTTGPYRYVRHPGYTGTLFGFILAPPLLLGSLWAFIPAGATAVVLVVRTILEDAMLAEELPGYREYRRQTRYRLIPCVW